MRISNVYSQNHGISLSLSGQWRCNFENHSEVLTRQFLAIATKILDMRFFAYYQGAIPRAAENAIDWAVGQGWILTFLLALGVVICAAGFAVFRAYRGHQSWAQALSHIRSAWGDFISAFVGATFLVMIFLTVCFLLADAPNQIDAATKRADLAEKDNQHLSESLKEALHDRDGEKQRADNATNGLDRAQLEIANDAAQISDLTQQRDSVQSQLDENRQQRQRLAELTQSRGGIEQAMNHVNTARERWVDCKLPPPPSWITNMCQEKEFMVGIDALAGISKTLYPDLQIDFSTIPDPKYSSMPAPDDDKQPDPLLRSDHHDRYFVVQRVLANATTLLKRIDGEITQIETKLTAAP